MSPAKIELLPQVRKVTFDSEWHEERAGGCHLFASKFQYQKPQRTWHLNPKFMLAVSSDQQEDFVITMSREPSEWAKRP